MTSEYDKQRDIAAEGQRAAIYHGTNQKDHGGSQTPDLDALAGMMRSAFEGHVDGLHSALLQGVKIVRDDRLTGVQVEMHVSPDAYTALQRRFDQDGRTL